MKKYVVFHGSPRKRNTYHAIKIFLSELEKFNDVKITEFFFPKDLPVFCAGCTLCFSGFRDKCPNAAHSNPIVEAMLGADALIFATPHYGAGGVPGSLQSLFDHLGFLTLTVSPEAAMFKKKAFVLTTGAGSAGAKKHIKDFLIRCGINRVGSLGLRMLADKWDNMPGARQVKFERSLRAAAKKFYLVKKGRPYISAVVFFYAAKHIIMKRYVGEGNYPYDNWLAKGYFKKRPF
ncbi:MAG: NAD(P)H-dependent oxidoreductase [Defluviitaleaceae bacterium]|nr:NAD(P)H-dependent oxidoreductase [Defluviitaleaceae bacterium]